MSGTALRAASAIVAEINASTWTPAISATRVWLPAVTVTSLSAYLVEVAPLSSEPSIMARPNKLQRVVRVLVRIARKLPHPSAVSDVDTVMDLVEQITEHFIGLRLPTFAPGLVTAAEEEMPEQESIQKHGTAIAAAVLTVTVEV